MLSLGLLTFGVAVGLLGFCQAADSRDGGRASLDVMQVLRAIEPIADTDRPIHVEFRRAGSRVGDHWCTDAEEFERALQDADADSAALFVATSIQQIGLGEVAIQFSNVHRGRRGAIVTAGDRVERLSPIDSIARNESFAKSFERLGIPRAESLSVIEGRTYLLRRRPDRSWSIREAPRFSRVVEQKEVTSDLIRELERAWLGYLLGSISPEGAAAYKFWPSRERFSSANNMIRQWMATEIMLRYLEAPELTADQKQLLIRNARFNTDRYLAELDDGRLVVLYEGKSKLGATAIAAMALDSAARAAPELGQQARALESAVLSALTESGRYRTFFVPPGRDDNQNFYPGEAQLMLARVYARTNDESVLEAFDRAFEYYKAWHLDTANRNPAFIPWHTQACAIMWKMTGEEKYRDFIFEMNDWLLRIQDCDPIYPEIGGRFYRHEFRRYGPPHASSTAVYLEGLVDAWAIAKESGDSERAGRYHDAILNGFRSLAQLTVLTRDDLFYVSDATARRCIGAVRTAVYHNEIRIDNVQHALSAAQKYLLLDHPDR